MRCEIFRQRFPRLVELYDNTASLQDRTVVDRHRPRRARPAVRRARLCRARRAARNFDARKAIAYAPYDQLDFTVPVLTAGDVNARVWIRIREVEQSFALIEQIIDRLPAGPIAAALDSGSDEGTARDWALPKVSAATCWSRCGSTAAASRAATCAIRRGSNGRCSRRRSKATSSPTSRSATNRSTARIRGTISDAPDAVRKPARTGRSPKRRRAADDAALAELAASVERARAAGSAAASRSARSMPAPATAASWKSTRSTTRSTISSASACASSPRRAMPTCCW